MSTGECTVCNVCDAASPCDGSVESARIPSNVRRFRDEVFTVWRCPACRSLHCREAVDLDVYYRHYPMQEHRLDFWARAAYAEYLRRLRGAGLKDTDRILDFGCGAGLLVGFLRERGFAEVAGYDAHVSAHAGTAVLDRAYEAVITQDVIEHLEDPRTFVAELAARVVPGGLLCIGTPNADGIDLGRPEVHALSLHQPYHRHILSEGALRTLVERQGFTTVAVHRRFYYDTLWPSVNYRFLREYVRRIDNTLDAAFEEPRVGLVLRSPALWFYALFGYVCPPRSEMMLLFRKREG